MIHNTEHKHQTASSSFFQTLKFRRKLLNISEEELANILDINRKDIIQCESGSSDINKNKFIIFKMINYILRNNHR